MRAWSGSRCCECGGSRPGHFLHSQSSYLNAEKMEQIRKAMVYLSAINARKNEEPEGESGELYLCL